MNVDLNWCPCGRQSREDSMYCSDTCYMKELASTNENNKNRKYFKKDSFFDISNPEKTHKPAWESKIPDFKHPLESLVLTASANLAFKNRQKYYYPRMSDYYGKNNGTLSSSYVSNTSTIDDYFKKQAFMTRTESATPRHSAMPITSSNVKESESENENAKEEKNEVKSYSSRSSYIIEAVYPVQNFTKTTIAVY